MLDPTAEDSLDLVREPLSSGELPGLQRLADQRPLPLRNRASHELPITCRSLRGRGSQSFVARIDVEPL